MFNWLFQLFGKTDYKQLKKELENEIQQRKDEYKFQTVEPFFRYKIMVFSDTKWKWMPYEFLSDSSEYADKTIKEFDDISKRNLEKYESVKRLLQQIELREKLKQRRHSK